MGKAEHVFLCTESADALYALAIFCCLGYGRHFWDDDLSHAKGYSLRNSSQRSRLNTYR